MDMPKKFNFRPTVRKRYVSLMNLSESDEDNDSKDLDEIPRILI